MEIKDSRISISNIHGDNNCININIPLDSILAKFIYYINTLTLEKQVKIMQFALEQKEN